MKRHHRGTGPLPFRRVLFVMPSSRNLRHVVETVTCLGGIDFECVIMDDGVSSGPCDLRVHEAFRRFVPDILILIPTIVAFDQMPSRGYLDAVRRDAHLPVVQVFTDLAKPVWQELAPKLVVAADLAVSFDGNGSLTVDRSSRPDIEWLELWTPVVPPTRYGGPRDIDLSMLGSFRDFPHRAAAIEQLQQSGISVVTGGGLETGYSMSPDDYYRILQRSRMVLNFSRLGTKNITADGFVHGLKGRVMEAIACGALLIESENNVTSRYFSEGTDYVSFADLDDLVAKIRFYADHEEKRRAIAESGRSKFGERYTAPIFWTGVFEAVARTLNR
jgi:glycosyltransferase involved in cell wall biosynthesis